MTIPKHLRENLAIGAGTELEFTEDHGALIARKVTAADPLGDLVGLLPRMSVATALADLRGPERRSDLDR